VIVLAKIYRGGPRQEANSEVSCQLVISRAMLIDREADVLSDSGSLANGRARLAPNRRVSAPG